MQYRPEIDGLRALAVIPVILFHAGLSGFQGGFVGVDIFFVISGYLITSIILKEKQRSDFSLWRFYERRARRILPALFLVIACCIPFAFWMMLPGELVVFAKSIIATLIFLSNLFFWQQGGYFGGNSELFLLLHTWSLSVEEQFYLFFPVFILVIWPICVRFGLKWLACALIVFSILSLAIAEWGWRSHPTANFYLSPSRAWELMVGSLCALIILHNAHLKPNAFLAGAGVGLVIYAIIAFDKATPFPSLYTLIPVIGTALIILFARDDNLIARLLSLRSFVVIGLFSYSTYLWHQPILAFARLHETFETGHIVFYFPLTMGLAWLSWRFVETPMRDRNTTSLRFIVMSLSGVAVLLTALSLMIIHQKGFVERYESHDREIVSLDIPARGAYVEERFFGFLGREFDDSSNTKHLIIGDSFAQDFTNIIYENGLNDDIQISTHWIRAGCGNLYLSEDSFTQNLSSKKRSECALYGRYEVGNILERIKQADVIWLASSWYVWEAGLLQESLERIQEITRADVYVVGHKNFGIFHPRHLLGIDASERKNYRQYIGKDAVKVNEIFLRSLPPQRFIDYQMIVCGHQEECPVFTPDLDLITFDGGHLTKAGAKYSGEMLMTSPIFRAAF